MTKNKIPLKALTNLKKNVSNGYTVSRMRGKTSLLTVESAVFALPKKE